MMCSVMGKRKIMHMLRNVLFLSLRKFRRLDTTDGDRWVARFRRWEFSAIGAVHFRSWVRVYDT